MSTLKGKVALITGGGRGLGEAICRRLADGGALIVVADIRRELAEEVSRSLRDQGTSARSLVLDVASENQVDEAVDGVIRTYGRLDILVNNAGVDVTVPVEELPVDAWDHIIAVNLRGPFLMSRKALIAMRRQGSGHIVNVVSTAAKRVWANASAYHASKWGLLGFSHALHVEARPQGVKVTAVIAGGMRTPFLLDRFPELDPGVLQNPRNVADTISFVLTQPDDTVIPEVLVIPMRETSWP